MPDPFYAYRPLLDLIARTEHTDPGTHPKARGYNTTLAYGAYTAGDRDLVRMTLDEIDHLQTAMLAHPQNSLNSSALGRYQIVRKTRRTIQKKLKLPGSALYNEATQDRMACYLLGGRGIDRYLAGRMSENALIDALAKEWASLPTTSGKGHYSGQRAAVDVVTVRRTLAEVKRRYSEGAKPAEKPVDGQKPPAATPNPSQQQSGAPAAAPGGKKKGLIGSILGALGIGAGAAAADPDRMAAWILVAIVVAIVIFVAVAVARKRK